MIKHEWTDTGEPHLRCAWCGVKISKPNCHDACDFPPKDSKDAEHRRRFVVEWVKYNRGT